MLEVTIIPSMYLDELQLTVFWSEQYLEDDIRQYLEQSILEVRLMLIKVCWAHLVIKWYSQYFNMKFILAK